MGFVVSPADPRIVRTALTRADLKVLAEARFGDMVKAVVDLLGPDGSKIHWEYTATLDGKPAPVTGNPDGDMVVAKRPNPNTIETSYTLKGKPTTVNTRVVSADGKTLTVTSTGTNAQGQKVNNHQVFEKS